MSLSNVCNFFLSVMTSLAHLTTLDLVLPQPPPFRSALPICDLKKMYVCNISTNMNAKYLIASVIFDFLKKFLLIGCLLENRGQFSTETFMQITKKETRKIDETTFIPWICWFQLFWMRKKKNFEWKKKQIEWKKRRIFSQRSISIWLKRSRKFGQSERNQSKYP